MKNVTPSCEAGNGDVRPKNDGEGEPSAHVPITKKSAVAVLHVVGRTAYEAAARLSHLERIDVLRRAVRPWDGETAVTLYFGGRTDARDGEAAVGTWDEFGEALAEHAALLVPVKGTGAWFTPALTTNGRCRDQDIELISQISFDCDGAGDWLVLRKVLDGAGLAYIVQRSASHCPEHPKWHLHIPLSKPWSGTKPEWRRIYRHAVGWFSGAAELHTELDATPPMYGFDAKTDRLGQPWFLPARRTDERAAPETVVVEGGALEL